MKKTISLNKAQGELTRIIEGAVSNKQETIIEKNATPLAVVVPYAMWEGILQSYVERGLTDKEIEALFEAYIISRSNRPAISYEDVTKQIEGLQVVTHVAD